MSTSPLAKSWTMHATRPCWSNSISGNIGGIVKVAYLFDPQAVKQVLVAAPVLADAHLEVEVDAGAELGLQRAAAGGADLTDLGAALADQDPLLRLGLGPDLGLDDHQPVVARLDLQHRDLNRVRDLLPGAVKHLLADQLGQQQLAGLVAAVLRRIHIGPLGNELTESL